MCRPTLALMQAISSDRLKLYLDATSNDLNVSIQLYELNISLSTVVFGLLHGLEIGMRNSMHDTLTHHFSSRRWFESDRLDLSRYHQDKLNAAIRDAGGPRASPGKVIAELTFGFWTDLAARQYHWSLWQPCLYRAFSNVRLARPVIHARLDLIRKLRNRVAHHERILTPHRTLYAGSGQYLSFDELLDPADWISSDFGNWLRTAFHLQSARDLLESIAVSGLHF